MTTYERAIRQGRWLVARKRWIPAATLVACVLALLVATPFRIIHGQAWLTILSLVLAFAGIALRAATAKARGAGSKEALGEFQPEGIYSIMRFPEIASALLIISSVVLYTGCGWFMIAAVMVSYPCTYCIILTREHVLQTRFGEQFFQWCRTTYAITPSIFNWQPATTGKRFITLFLAESRVMMGLTVCFCLLNLVKNWRVDFEFSIDLHWLVVLAVTTALTLFTRKLREK